MGCGERQPRLCVRRGVAGAAGTTLPTSHPVGSAVDPRRESGAAVVVDSHQQCRRRYDDARVFIA